MFFPMSRLAPIFFKPFKIKMKTKSSIAGGMAHQRSRWEHPITQPPKHRASTLEEGAFEARDWSLELRIHLR